MNNFWVVFTHTFVTKIKSKQFLWVTAITVGITLLLVYLPSLIGKFNGDGEKKIALIDQTGQLEEAFKQSAANLDKNLKFTETAAEEQELKEKVLEGELDGYLLLSFDEAGLPRGVFKAETLTDQSLAGNLQMALQQVRSQRAAQLLNLNAEQLAMLNAPADFRQAAIGENAKTEEELNQARGLVYSMLIIIYFAVIMYASMIATEVATEKSSRVMEILISSVSPVTHMFAKIFAVASVGVVQMIIILAAGYGAVKRNMDTFTGEFFQFFGFGGFSLQTIIYGIVFFLLGFLLYATIAAFLGSLVSRIEDVNQMVSPLIFTVVIAFMLAMAGLSNPAAPYVTVTSYIPFFTPMLMFLRVGMLDVPLWETALSIGLLVGCIALFAYFGAKIYKGGVLFYGSAGLVKQIKRALQMTKENG